MPTRNDLYCDKERPVETERVPQLGDFFLRRAFAEHRLRRIAGHEMDQREHERRDAEQHGNGQQQPAEEISKHECSPENICGTQRAAGWSERASGDYFSGRCSNARASAFAGSSSSARASVARARSSAPLLICASVSRSISGTVAPPASIARWYQAGGPGRVADLHRQIANPQHLRGASVRIGFVTLERAVVDQRAAREVRGDRSAPPLTAR